MIFMKLCAIVDYRCGKNPVSFGVDSIQNLRLPAIVDFCYNVLRMQSGQSVNDSTF